MKALVKYLAGPGNVEIREVPEPRCGDDQVILEVTYCGICGTDLHVYDDKFRNFPPVILGHEISGTVVERGPAVRSVRPGDKIAVLGATTVTCGRCCYCRAGQFMFCRERRGMGHGVDGGFARFLAAREDQAYVLPGNATLEDGAICEPFASAVHAVLEVTDPAPK
jgi:L-iditol 2-dehydrogenase